MMDLFHPDGYDTLLQGGDMVYPIARGTQAEEIVVDGDGLHSTSKVLRLVPLLLDTLDIKVYERTGHGSKCITQLQLFR